jgi:hypothetical protein
MAKLAAEREGILAKRYQLQQSHELFWGYTASVWLVVLSEATILALAAWKIYSKHYGDTAW